MSFGKSLFKDFTIYGFAGVIGKLLALITLPIISRVFSVEEYGIIETINSSMAFFPLLIGLGYDMAIKKSVLIDADDYVSRKTLVSTVFWFLVAWGGLCSSVLFTLSGPISKALFGSDYYVSAIRISIINVYLSLLLGLSLTILRVYFKVASFSLISIVRVILDYSLIMIFVVLYNLGINGYFFAFLITTASLLVLGAILIKKDLSFSFDFSELKKVLQYSIPLLAGSLAFWVFNLSDRIVLSALSDVNQTGIYSMAVRMVSVLPFVIMAFKNAWVPRAFQYYRKNEEEFLRILNSIHAYGLAFFSVLAIGNLVFARVMLVIFTTEKFFEALYIMWPLCLAYIFYPLTSVGAIGIYLSNKTKYVTFISWVGALTNIVINIIFVKRFGAIVASISTALSYIVIYVLYWRTSEKLMNWKIHYTKPAAIVGLALLAILAVQLVRIETVFLDLMIKLFILLIFVVLLFAFGVFRFSEIKKYFGGRKRNGL
ncbi:oligosaccharide flippase family protein [Mesotoga sp. UBA5557]|jgi:O-antigen/teichoic acid export membrane protein|uniref:oligosaccharide flippase family protein n=1 Tax=Mesotoga sp. UBA5557 TaxID=1946857 RepID=UPI0025D7CBA0|nr:oligosaccharide flippase family protein [Mesotoga sp. UBA5557]